MWMVATGCLSRERLPIMSQAENHDPNTSFAWSEKGSINPTLHLRIHILRAQVSTKVTFQRRFFFESYANLQPKSIEGSKLKEKKLFHFAGLDAQQNGSFMHFLWIGGCRGFWSVESSKHGWSAELCTALIPQLRCLYKTLKRVVFLLSWCSWRQTPGGTTPKKGTGHWANCAQFANQWTHRIPLISTGFKDFHEELYSISSWLKQSVWSTCSSFILFSGRQFLLQKEMERTTEQTHLS